MSTPTPTKKPDGFSLPMTPRSGKKHVLHEQKGGLIRKLIQPLEDGTAEVYREEETYHRLLVKLMGADMCLTQFTVTADGILMEDLQEGSMPMSEFKPKSMVFNELGHQFSSSFRFREWQRETYCLAEPIHLLSQNIDLLRQWIHLRERNDSRYLTREGISAQELASLIHDDKVLREALFRVARFQHFLFVDLSGWDLMAESEIPALSECEAEVYEILSDFERQTPGLPKNFLGLEDWSEELAAQVRNLQMRPQIKGRLFLVAKSLCDLSVYLTLSDHPRPGTRRYRNQYLRTTLLDFDTKPVSRLGKYLKPALLNVLCTKDRRLAGHPERLSRHQGTFRKVQPQNSGEPLFYEWMRENYPNFEWIPGFHGVDGSALILEDLRATLKVDQVLDLKMGFCHFELYTKGDPAKRLRNLLKSGQRGNSLTGMRVTLAEIRNSRLVQGSLGHFAYLKNVLQAFLINPQFIEKALQGSRAIEALLENLPFEITGSSLLWIIGRPEGGGEPQLVLKWIDFTHTYPGESSTLLNAFKVFRLMVEDLREA